MDESANDSETMRVVLVIPTTMRIMNVSMIMSENMEQDELDGNALETIRIITLTCRMAMATIIIFPALYIHN